MSITTSELHHDTYHFFSKQIVSIFFISVSVTLLTIAIDMLLKTDMHIMSIINHKRFFNSHSLLDFINHMNTKEKYELLKYSIFKITSSLMSRTLLLGGIISLILHLSYNQKKSIIFSIYTLSKFLPNLFILNFITIFIIQISFMLFVVPGIFLSILLSLSPIILYFKKNKITNSIFLSASISWKNITIIGPGIILWMSAKFILTVIFSNIHFINNNIMFLILNTSTNILYSILIIYLFRFYMLFTSLKIKDF